MAALPLTLDTLQSPSIEEPATQSPLMSPQILKADSSSNNTLLTTTTTAAPERPSNLTLDSSPQHQQHHQHQHQQQQHSNITPTHGTISPALSSAGSLSPSFLPEMPQWKRDLIQRRKQNVQRTISASSPTATAAASSPLAASPTTSSIYGLKTSTSSSSVRSLAGSNTNIDQVASDGLHTSTKDYNKTSLSAYSTSSTSSLTTAAATTKVNKQHATITTTTTAMPATIIKSPIQEKAEKLFGGQYTATTSSSSSSLLSSSSSISATVTTTLTTKEEKKITTTITQQELMEGLMENEQEEEAESEHWEKSKKTKEYMIDTEEEVDDENDETQISTVTTTTTTNKQQMATRLTGSTHNNALAQREGMLKEREQLSLNNTQQQHTNITGANVILQNQSLNKCESERLVCAANNSSSCTNTAVTNNNINNNNNNTNTNTSFSGINSSIGSNGSGSSSSSSSSSNNSSVVKISQKLQDNQFIKNEQQQQQNNTNPKKFIKFKTNSYSSQDLKSPTKATTTSSSTSSALATTNCAIKKKMVAMQEMKKSTQSTATHLHPISTTCNNSSQQAQNNNNHRANNNRGNVVVGGGVGNSSSATSNATDLDNNEDLSYGPGIVSKLRCRYLSLALRESMEQQRLNKDQLRRSTSLNNLLDNNEDDDDDDDDNCDHEDDDEEDEENIEIEGGGVGVLHDKNKKNNSENSILCKKTGILKNSCNNQEKRFSHNSQGSNGVGVTFTETSFNKRSRHLKRGNDSLKRARSVEALLSEKSPWQSRTINTTPPTCVTIEDKIHNARERLHQGSDHMPPKRLTSIIDDTERPPPDLVKQTLKMFEASANRRPRLTNRSNSKGDVASKVETFKNIIKDQKPVVSYPKPTSPTKKLNTTPLQKPVQKSSPQASDLLQSPLGRKTLATANSNSVTDGGLTPLKTNNTLSDNTPDIIPRQKVLNERDFKQTKEKFTTSNQMNKEKFLNSIRDAPLSNMEIIDSPLSVLKREQKEKFEVDSPMTALTKELNKMKLSDNNTPTRKIDSFAGDNYEISNGGGGGGGGGAGGDSVSVGGDACLSHKNPHNNEENKELNNSSSLKNENDKQKQINNETIDETTNEATVNYNDCLATKASPPPSSSDLSDGEEDDDEYGGLKTKRITRTALDNIAKAGYTQQFKFNSNSATSNSNSPNNSNNTTHSTSSPLNSGKQIGVIRPLLNTNQQQQQQQKISSDMDTLKHSTPSSLTSREIEKNRINDLKKSSATSTASSTTSSPNTSLDNVIKSSSSSSSLASANSEVDTVISATNSPLWAMRKRRQTPPAAATENTTMVFNFSNRKEVPDYIENDGVIFRRKRELPKPNESGFVLLGDLSVETSTDFDCDDFSMCPPSPCDVEFENANIVIDGKSSIRQKSKDASFRVQFNDTLTSTFEYPSEASLIVDDSFSAYNDGYTQPHGSSGDDFQQAFQNLVLENFASSADQMSNPFPLHHVADEIIQLPTANNQASSPANTTTGVTTTPTKNILGNLPLDYPDLEKGTQLTIPTTTTATTATPTTQENKLKRSRKDLNLPLGNHQLPLPKPPLPMKRFQMMPLKAQPQKISKGLARNSKELQQLPKQILANVAKPKEEESIILDIKNECGEDTTALPKQRRTPQVLNNPQYACFLQQQQQQQQQEGPTKYPVQRSRSNEFQKSFGSLAMSATPVLRSNSLRNLEKFHTSPALTPTSSFTTTTTTSLYFSAEVNSTIENILRPNVATAKLPAKEYRTLKSVSLHNLPQTSESFENFSNSCHELTTTTECIDNFRPKTLSPSKSLNALTIEENSCYMAENLLNSKSESLDNFNSNSNLKPTSQLAKQMTANFVTSTKDLQYSTEYSVNMTENLLNSKSNSVDNFKSTEMAENFLNSTTKSLNDLASANSSQNLTDYSVKVTKNSTKSKSTSSGSFRATVRSSVNDLTEYFSFHNKSKSTDNFTDLTEKSVKMTENLLNINNNESLTDSSKMTDNPVNCQQPADYDLINLQKTSANIPGVTTNCPDSAVKNPSHSSFINLNKTLQMSIDSLDDYEDALEVSQECDETQKQSVTSNCGLTNLTVNQTLNLVEQCENNDGESTLKLSQAQEQLTDSEALGILGPHKESLATSQKQLTNSEALDILEDIAVGLNTNSLFDFSKLMRADKHEISTEKLVNLTETHKIQEKTDFISKTPNNSPLKSSDASGKISKPKHVKTTGKLFNFTNLSCENASTYSTFRKSQNFCRHASKSFKNSLKFYETLNDKASQLSGSIKRSKSFAGNLSTKGEINRTGFAKSSKSDKNSNNSQDSPTENSYSFDYYDASGDFNGNLSTRSLTENASNSTNNDCLNNNENLLKQKQEDLEIKLEINQNANDLKESSESVPKVLKNSSNFLTKKSVDFTNLSADLTENPVKNIKICVTKQLLNEETPIDFNANTSSNNELLSVVSGPENSFPIQRNLSRENLNSNPNNDLCNFNASPRPFRRKYEATTVVVTPEKGLPLSHPLCDLNSPESLTLTSPRPFKSPSKTLDSWNRGYTASDSSVNFKNSPRLNLTNSFGTLTNNFGTLTNNFGTLTKSIDSALNVEPLTQTPPFFLKKKEFETPLGNSTGNLNLNLTKFPVVSTNPSTTVDTLKSLKNSQTSDFISSTAVDKSSAKFSTHSPGTLKPNIFSNTKHLKLQTKLALPDNSFVSSTSSSQTVKDPTTTTTTNTNKESLKKCTNFKTKVEVSKPKTYSTSISQSTSSSSFSSTTFCHTSSTANSQQVIRNSTTIASNSTNPPKVLPRRIFTTTAPRNVVAATMNCSSATYTAATTATTPVSGSSSSTSSCYNASTSATTSNNSTPLRRRIPGNTLYYV